MIFATRIASSGPRPWLALLPLICSLALTACTSTGEGGTPPPAVKKTIGAEGGTITLDNGVTVTVPKNAVPANVEIGVSWQPDTSELTATLPEGVEGALDGAVVLTPHGTQFAEPVKVTVPTTLVDDDFVFLRLADESATEWTAEGPAKRVGNTLEFTVLEFSTYSAAAVKAGACPCWNAADMDAFEAMSGTRKISFHPQYGVGLAIARVGSGAFELRGWSSGGTTISKYFCERLNVTGTSNTKVDPITTKQASACFGLLRARFADKRKSNLNVGAATMTLNAGESAEVELTITPPAGAPAKATVTLTDTNSLVWADGVFASGTTVSATVLKSPAGVTCTALGVPSTLANENLAVMIDCQLPTTSTCPTVATGQTAPGTLAKTPASSTALTDDFSGTTLDTDRWDVSVSEDMAWTLSNGALVGQITTYQDMFIGGLHINPAGRSSSSGFPLSGLLTATLKVAPPDLSQVTASQMSVSLHGENFQAHLSISAQFSSDAGGNVSSDGTYAIYLNDGSSNPIEPKMIKLDATTNTIALTLDPQKGTLSVTVTGEGGAQETLSITGTFDSDYSFNTQFQAMAAATATLPLDTWRIDAFETNQTLHMDEFWSLLAPGLMLGSTPYNNTGDEGSGVMWFNDAADEDLFEQLDERSTPISFDGTPSTVFARLCSVTVDGQGMKLTLYSSIADDAAFSAALSSALDNAIPGSVVTATVDAKATAFTRQNDGTYLWGLACP